MSRTKWSSQLTNGLVLLLCLLTFLSLLDDAEAALFDGCDHTFNVNPGLSYVESPYYPSNYPAGTSCRYNFVAPLDYEIQVQCTINLDKNPDACSSEFFYIARDGDVRLRGSEQFCGAGTFTRKSLFNKAVVAYVSYGATGSGRFRCSLTATQQACDCGWSVNTKIVNGQETNINEYPSMVALRDRSSNLASYCAGSIISHRFILTATHCARVQSNPAYILALVGDHNLGSNTETQYAAQYTIMQIIEYPGYQSDPVVNDIALLKTTNNIEWSRGVGPICLPPPANAYDTFAYNYVDVMGWGTTSFGGPSSSVLRKVNLMVATNAACQQSYQGVTTINTGQICTYDSTGTSKDSCQYDSGGPVVLRKARQFLLGCISFGKVCGQGGYAMGVNTRVTTYLNWIYQTTSSSTCTVSM